MYTPKDLKDLQAMSLADKVDMTKTLIDEWYQFYTTFVYCSFSGGKDSTVLVDLCKKVHPDIPVVFFDTGLEWPEIRDFVKTFDNVTWLKPKKNFRQIIMECGYPVISKEVAELIQSARNNPDGYAMQRFYDGSEYNAKTGDKFSLARYKYLLDSDIPISAECCKVMKKDVAKEYTKTTGRKPLVATLAEESRQRRLAWLKSGCNSYGSREPKSTPMSFWTKQDILEYIHEYNLPIASIYGKLFKDEYGKWRLSGADRTGCVFCAFGAHLEKAPNRFQKMKVTHPQLWEYCMKPIENGGLGMREVLEKVGIPIE